MTVSIHNMAYKKQLDDFVSHNNLSVSDLCIVGSSCLSIRNLRSISDLDICLRPLLQREICARNFQNIELSSNRYEVLGISDEAVFR